MLPLVRAFPRLECAINQASKFESLLLDCICLSVFKRVFSWMLNGTIKTCVCVPFPFALCHCVHGASPCFLVNEETAAVILLLLLLLLLFFVALCFDQNEASFKTRAIKKTGIRRRRRRRVCCAFLKDCGVC